MGEVAAVIQPHPDFEQMTLEELEAARKELEDKISFATEHRAETVFKTWLIQERRLLLAEIGRRNGGKPQSHTTAKPKQEALWPELISAKDLLALPPDPTRWIWDNALPVGACSVLVAKPKVGKSHLAVNFSIAVARGHRFLERDTQRCPVAYLSLDASLPEISEIFIKFGLKESDPIFIHAGGAPTDALKWLIHNIQSKGVRVVIIDVLQRLFRFENVNDYSEVTNALEPLLEAAREHKCHILLLHHAKKEAGDDLDSAIGSSAIRGLAYAYLHLKRLPNSERRILRSDQRGGKNFSEVQIAFGRDDWLEVGGTREEAEIEDAKPKIKEFLEAEGREVTEKEIRAAVPIRYIIISKALRQMFKADEIQRQGRGRKNDPFRYSLTASLVNENVVPGRGYKGEGFWEPN